MHRHGFGRTATDQPAARQVLAQDGDPARDEVPARPVAPPAQPAAKPLSAAEIKAKQQILESDRWRCAIAEMNEWLSVQTTYSPQQIERLKMELVDKIQVMSPTDLEGLLGRMEAKLNVLLSPDAQAARNGLPSTFPSWPPNPKKNSRSACPIRSA